MEPNKAEDSQSKWLKHFIVVENCLIAELHRLAEEMPIDFVKPQTSRYAKLLLDFSYFEKRMLVDEYVSSNDEGRSLDEEFYAQFTDYLNQFFRTLDALFSLLNDYMEFAEKTSANSNLLDRRFVKLNALKCETLYLLGVVLLLLEAKFSGLIKERIFVAYYRSNMNFATRKFELLVSILRNRKENFESCFQHIQINESYVEQLIDFLRYYATQQPDSSEVDGFTNEKLMAMIYVCLYFKSDILHNQFSVMRQIVDKYFQSDYIVPVHIELTVSLLQKWEPYKAASSTLQSTVDSTNVSRKFFEVHKKFQQLSFPAGPLSVENLGEYAELVGEFNDCLRWLVLHSSEVKPKKTSMFGGSTPAPLITSQELFQATVKVSQFEHKLKQSCHYIISHKIKDSERLKARICNVFDQIVLLINNQMFQDCPWNDKLSDWIKLMQEEIKVLDPNNMDTPQLIEHYIAKIDEVSELQQQFAMVILQQYFSLALADLKRLKNICLVQQSFVKRIEQRTDSIYIWGLLPNWMRHFEDLLKNDALAVKFVFFKLTDSISNFLDSALKIDKPKADILSNYYNKKLEKRLRRIIQIIPHAIFEQLDTLQNLLPVNTLVAVEKTYIRQYADLERRRLLAQKVYEITKLSLGISNMCINHLGSVEISPRQLLLDGFRNELKIKLKALLDADQPSTVNILKLLNEKIQKLRSFREAFVFVCEHLSINGMQLWQTQLQSVLSVALESEKNALKHKSLVVSQQRRQKSIFGTLLDTFLAMTNPKSTYLLFMSDRYATNDLKKISFCSEVFNVLENLGPGVTNTYMRSLVDAQLFIYTQMFTNECSKSATMFNHRSLNLRSISQLNNTPEFIALYRRLLDLIARIGQMKVLRENLDVCIQNNLDVRVRELFNASLTLHKSILYEEGRSDFDKNRITNLKYFIHILERLLSGPKIVTDERKQIELCAAMLISIFFITYLKTTATSKKESVDPAVIVTGVRFLLRKFHVEENFKVFNTVKLNGAIAFPSQKQFKSAQHVLHLKKV